MVRSTLDPADLPQGRSRVAVIGLGMAGATAAHLLAKKHDVVAIEALPQAGLHFHSIADGDISFDVPLRAMSPHYYPNLFRWYRELGVELASVNYQSTGSDAETHTPYFQYSNLIVFGYALPCPRIFPLAALFQTVVIVVNYLWLVFASVFRLATDRRKRLDTISTGAYLREGRYAPCFVDRFFLPVMSTLLSCSYEQVLGYPASLVLDFFCARHTTLFTGWWRLREGVQAVSKRLLSGLECRYNCGVARIERRGLGTADASVRIHYGPEAAKTYGKYEDFDYVVLATDAPVAARLLADGSADERTLVNAVSSFTARIVAHTDRTLMPTDPASWSGLNYFSSEDDLAAARAGSPAGVSPRNASMTTAHMTRFGMRRCATSDFASSPPPRQPLCEGADDAVAGSDDVVFVKRDGKHVFQTWNPYREPAEGEKLRESRMSRAVWTVDGLAAFDDAVARGAQGSRRIWFAGSYASRGVTLLEQACTSAMDVAADFGVDPGFKAVHESKYWWPLAAVGALLHALAWIMSFLRRLLLPSGPFRRV